MRNLEQNSEQARHSWIEAPSLFFCYSLMIYVVCSRGFSLQPGGEVDERCCWIPCDFHLPRGFHRCLIPACRTRKANQGPASYLHSSCTAENLGGLPNRHELVTGVHLVSGNQRIIMWIVLSWDWTKQAIGPEIKWSISGEGTTGPRPKKNRRTQWPWRRRQPMHNFRKVLSTFRTYCPVGVQVAKTVDKLPTFKFRPGWKRVTQSLCPCMRSSCCTPPPFTRTSRSQPTVMS